MELTRRQETKMVKAALYDAGIKARVGHGSGTSWGWLYITVDRSLMLKNEIVEIAQRVTGRKGDYDGDISVFAE